MAVMVNWRCVDRPGQSAGRLRGGLDNVLSSSCGACPALSLRCSSAARLHSSQHLQARSQALARPAAPPTGPQLVRPRSTLPHFSDLLPSRGVCQPAWADAGLVARAHQQAAELSTAVAATRPPPLVDSPAAPAPAAAAMAKLAERLARWRCAAAGAACVGHGSMCVAASLTLLGAACRCGRQQPPPRPAPTTARLAPLLCSRRRSVMGRKDYNEPLITVVRLTGVLQHFSGPARAPAARRLLNVDRVVRRRCGLPCPARCACCTCCTCCARRRRSLHLRLCCAPLSSLPRRRNGLRGRSARASAPQRAP